MMRRQKRLMRTLSGLIFAGVIGSALPIEHMSSSALAAGPLPKTDRYGVFDIGGKDEPRIRKALADLGIGWVRLQYRLGERETDFCPVLKAGYALWLTIYNRDRNNIREQGTVGYHASSRGGFAPRDRLRYQDDIRRAVRPLAKFLRARGKRPADWRVIQIGNEVVPRDVYPRTSPAGSGTARPTNISTCSRSPMTP